MIALRYIKDLVNESLSIDISDNNKQRKYSDGRALYYVLCREFTHSTLNDIGKEVGRDHSTVVHGMQNIFHLVDKMLYTQLRNQIVEYFNLETQTTYKKI